MTRDPSDIEPADEAEREGLLAELEAWSRTPMLVLSGIWLVLLVIELVRGGTRLMETLGLLIWAVFVLEFVARLWLAPQKLQFIARNWLTVLALAVPALRLVRILRVLRFIRLARVARSLRLIRLVGSANRGMNALRRTMRRRGLAYVLLLTAVVIMLGAAGMGAFERDGPNAAAFDTYWEALWWTAMIITTMGSQAWPATVEGQVLTLLLSAYSVGVFGYIAAAFASFFVERDRKEADDLEGRIGALQDEIAGLRQDLRAPGAGSGPKGPLA